MKGPRQTLFTEDYPTPLNKILDTVWNTALPGRAATIRINLGFKVENPVKS